MRSFYTAQQSRMFWKSEIHLLLLGVKHYRFVARLTRGSIVSGSAKDSIYGIMEFTCVELTNGIRGDGCWGKLQG